jgi:hypothetical protein
MHNLKKDNYLIEHYKVFALKNYRKIRYLSNKKIEFIFYLFDSIINTL